MDIPITTIAIMAMLLIMAGCSLLIVWPYVPRRPKKQEPHVTVKGGGSIVTVRNAGGGDFSVIFSSGQSEDEQVVPASTMDDKKAEEEVTILDELRDPRTPSERKAAIERELLALGYQIARRSRVVQTNTGKASSSPEGDGRPIRKQASSKPSEPSDDDADAPSLSEGVDEGLFEQEPQFDDFYAPID